MESTSKETTITIEPNAEEETVPAEAETSLPLDEKSRFYLYRAALDGDWKKAEKYYNIFGTNIEERISKDEDTALHIAVAAERTAFVKKLVEKIDGETIDILSKRNEKGNTPFCLAAVCGNVELAKMMMEKEKLIRHTKNSALPLDKTSDGMLPLEIAALFGRKDMIKLLYYTSDSVQSLDGPHRINLLLNLISADIALNLVITYPDLATTFDEVRKETALHALARITISKRRGFLNRYFNPCTMFRKKEQQQEAAVELVKILLEKASKKSYFLEKPDNKKLIFVAAAQGNTEFLNIFINRYPDLILEIDNDKNNRTIFHYAIIHRHKEIFKLIYKIGSFKDLITPYQDEQGNNILHLAGKLAPQERLNTVSGAALQLQQELLWFKEVEKIMNPLDTEATNKKRESPRALFTKQHKKLKADGEKWMKDTANSCMIVATLIATVVFAAAFTVPGSTKQDTGTPIFLRKDYFTIFAISDAISLVLSSCSILTFLSILTSRYTEEDFIRRLPTMLFIGLLTLFLSVEAMMIVFCATFFIVFNDGGRWRAKLVTGIASAPVILFVILQYRLIVDIVKSTYFSYFLFRPWKRYISFKEEKAKKS